MKDKLFLFLTFFFLITTFSYTQTPHIRIIISSVMTDINLGGLVPANNLQGAPHLFTVEIFPENIDVKIRGNVSWSDFGQNNFRQVAEFTTHVFQSRTFSNSNLGSDIRIESSRTESAIIDELMARGVAAGTVIIQLTLLDRIGNSLANTSAEVLFTSGSQTLFLSLQTPSIFQNIGNVLVSWTPVSGATGYRIRANKKLPTDATLEAALEKSGQPLIDDADPTRRLLATETSVDLRNLLQYDWSPGDNIVAVVYAEVEGKSYKETKSNIINFTIENPALQQNVGTLPGTLTNLIGLMNLPDGTGILNLLASGNIVITGFTNEGGRTMSQEEVNQILQMLTANPALLVNIYRR